MPGKKSSETLEEGLDRSARKKGYTGKERQRYVGGAIRNMEKRGAIGKIKPRTSHIMHHAAPKPAHKPVTHHVAAPAKPTPPKEKISLIVKKSGDSYRIYNAKTNAVWGDSRFRTPSKAKAEAKIEQDAHNAGYKRGRL